MKKRFSKISIHSLGFRIFVLLAVMIVLFCALVVYNNTAAFGLMLERIHENSENTLVLYQKSLDENLSRTETYLYVFALMMPIFFRFAQRNHRQPAGMSR